MLGERFSAADVMLGSTLGWCKRIGLLTDQPVLDADVTRLSARRPTDSGVAPAFLLGLFGRMRCAVSST